MIITFFNPFSLRFGGGAERWLLEVSRRFCERGHQVNVISLSYASELKLNHCGKNSYFHYSELPYIKLPRGNPFPSIFSIKPIMKQFTESDLVYFNIYAPNELFLRLFSKRLRTPLIGGFHTFIQNRIALQNVYTFIMKYSLRSFDAFHVLNNHLLRLLKEWKCENVHLISNGVDTSTFSLCKHPSDENLFNVLFVGRLSKAKGIETLIRVINDVNHNTDLTDIRFTIVGTGPMRSFIESFAKKNRNVKYLGFIPHDKISKVYKNASMFLYPSFVENMPLCVLEAQSCGLPVVGSNIPGLSDLIINRRMGVLYRIDDVKGFSKAIRSYYDLYYKSPNEYDFLCRTIRSHIVNNYDWSIIMDKLEIMFEQSSQLYSTG